MKKGGCVGNGAGVILIERAKGWAGGLAKGQGLLPDGGVKWFGGAL